MKNIFKKTFIVLLSAIIIFAGTAPVSNAASKHMIIVNTKKNTLNYYVNYTLVKKFRCATGKASTPTPQRKTTIVNKIKNRPYYKTGIPGGDPRNPLGKRWMGLNIDGTQGSTYGIHGNNNEKSIGKNVSHGCIRMHNSEVEWLFDQVPLGTVVLIKNTSNSDNYIANYYNVKLLQSGWFTENKKTYYRKSNGQLAKGWTTISGKTYYFGKSKGQLYTGWATIGGNKYYLGTDGARRTGWQTIGENKYYFNSKGVLIKNKTSYKIKGKEYEINSEGVAIQVSALKAECLRKAKKFIEKHTTANMSNAQKFRTCFNYLMGYTDFKPWIYPTDAEFKTQLWPYQSAVYMFDNNLSGSCYGVASAVAACAKVLGYEPYVIATTGDHGFVMIDGLYYDNMGPLFGASTHFVYSVRSRVKF